MKRITENSLNWKIDPGNGIPIWRQILARIIVFFALILSAAIYILPVLIIIAGILSILYLTLYVN